MVKVKRKNRLETVAKKQVTIFTMLKDIVPQDAEIKLNTCWADTEINTKYGLSMIWNSCAFFVKDVHRFAGSDYTITYAQKKGTFIKKI